MKQLLSILLMISFNAASMQCIMRARAQRPPRNMQLCLNTTPDFGKRHFILGYKQKNTFVAPVVVVEQKKQVKKNKRPRSKKQQLPGAELVDKNRPTQSFFTSIHDLSAIVLDQLLEAKKSIHIAAFALTDSRIADLLIEKHKAGIEICVITDAGNMKHSYSKIHKLVENNVPVWRYSPALNPHYNQKGLYEPFMHHKCICIDRELVVTGSANLTRAGQKDNIENINILRDAQAVNEHCEEIQRLKKYCTECKAHDV